MKKVFSLLIVLSIILGTVNVYAAEPTISWFGDATNDYTEGFESFGAYAQATGVINGTVVAANNGQKLITGEKYPEAEPSRNFGYATKTEITNGIAGISFGMRIRSSADGSISFTETDTAVSTQDHISDNVFQIRTNGANIDLYVNDQKKAQLTTKNQLDGNKMSSIMKIYAAYDFENKNLRVKADLYDTAVSSVIETQTVDVELDDSVTSLCGMQIISKANYTGLAFDDFRVIKSNEANIDNVIPAPAKPTQQPDRIIYVSDNFDRLSQNDGSYIVQMPGNTSTAKSVENSDGGITFYAEGRKNGSSDYKTGIKVGTNGSDKFVTGVSGNYANGDRHTYMTFNNVPAFADMGGKTLSMEFDMKMTTTSADMSFNDGTNKAFAFKISNNMLAVSNGNAWVEIPGTAKDTWYDVKVIANRQSGMYTLLISKDNRVIYTNTLSYQGTPSTISRIDFSKDVANAGDVASLNNIEIYCGKTAPIINNVSGAKFGNDLVLTFDDDSEWREVISTVYVNGEPIENNETGYSIAEGSLTIDSTVLEKAGVYTITVSAADYSDVIISQVVTADITDAVIFEKITVNEGTRLEDVMAQFTKEYEFKLEDGETLKAQLSWSQTSVPEYDMLAVGDYVSKASIDGLPEYATIPEGYEVNQTVAVNVPEDINIESANVIEPLSYNVSNNIATVGDIIAKLPTRASITLAGGTVYEADVTWVCDGKDNIEGVVEGTYSFASNYQNLPSYIKNPNEIYPKVQVNMVTAAAVRVSESLITDNSLPSAIFASSFGNDNLVTYNEYQSAVYYTADQHPAISRRVVDSDEWETIIFDDYTRKDKEDGHYVIVMGICAEDGTIHMAWDGWNSPLKYRISAKVIKCLDSCKHRCYTDKNSCEG